MISELTDAQVARVFDLCEKIVAVREGVPAPPFGMGAEAERAKNLRSSLDAHNNEILELSALLR